MSKDWESKLPRQPKVAREEKESNNLTAGWGIAVGIALLIGWAATSARPDGFDWTGQCLEPTVQLGC